MQVRVTAESDFGLSQEVTESDAGSKASVTEVHYHQ